MFSNKLIVSMGEAFQRVIGWVWNKRIMLVLVIAFAQCLSIWNYQGDKVDESELVHFAVGFLGGDLDPHWYGYGSFGMYFLSLIFLVIGQILIFLGAFENVLEYASSLYDSPLFFIVSRYVFAVIGMLAVMVYAKIARRLGVPVFVIFLFILLAVFSKDGLSYANYIRCDQLLSLVFAVLLYICIFDSDNIKGQLVLALLMSAAVTTKINAIFCLPILFIPLIVYGRTFKDFFKRSSLLFGVFLLGTLVLQPYHTIFHSIYDTYALRLAGDATFNYSKTIHVGFIEHLKAIAQVYLSTISPLVLSALVFIPLTFKKYFSLTAYIVVFVFLYTAVYFLSWEVTSYWFLPTFLPVRLLCCVSFYCFLDFVIPARLEKYIGIPFVVGFVFYCGLIALPRYSSFGHSVLTANENKWAAKSWICQNGVDSILLDAHYDYVMPSIYEASDIERSKLVSNAFIYGRSENAFLNEAFEAFLLREEESCPSVKSVSEVRAFDVEVDLEEWRKRKNKFMVVSPDVYNRFLNNPGKRFSPEKLKELQLFQDYYKKILSQTLVSRFDKGTGPVIEIYQLR